MKELKKCIQITNKNISQSQYKEDSMLQIHPKISIDA